MKAQRWQRRKEARAPEILEAALACFAEKGFAATRMDDIAARAGYHQGHDFYLYFDSKEALFKALARRSIGAHLETVMLRVQTFEGHTADLLRFVLAAMGAMVRTSDSAILPKILLAEVGNFPELAEFWRREIIDRGLGLFEQIINRRGIASRRASVMFLPQHAARLCVAPMIIVALWRTIFDKFDAAPYDYQGLIDTHIDTLLPRSWRRGKRTSVKTARSCIALCSRSLACDQKPDDAWLGYGEGDNAFISAPQPGWVTQMKVQRWPERCIAAICCSC